jgi:ATP-dependent DNA ligase
MPFQPPFQPMLAVSSETIPRQSGLCFEPKLDGWRCIVFWDGKTLRLQSRNGKALEKYFPELIESLCVLPAATILDGELLIVTKNRRQDFQLLMTRIQSSKSRIQELSSTLPASFIAFDLLALTGKDLRRERFEMRRKTLEGLSNFSSPHFQIVPMSQDWNVAERWLRDYRRLGIEGVVAKKCCLPYQSGKRTMVKIKNRQTIDCVICGISPGGSLLLGLYEDGTLHIVGQTVSRTGVAAKIKSSPTRVFSRIWIPDGLRGWVRGSETSWMQLSRNLVAEIAFDHFENKRFRHLTRFIRWRTDKSPLECSTEQVDDFHCKVQPNKAT